MADDLKLTGLTELTAPSQDDWLYVVDKSDTTDGAAGSSRKITIGTIGSLPRVPTNPDGESDQPGLIGQRQIQDVDEPEGSKILDRVYIVPFYPRRSSTITDIGCVPHTTQPSSLVRVAIYNADQTTGRPTTLVSDIGTMATDTSPLKSITGLSISVEPQLYWWAHAYDVSSVQLRCIPIIPWGIHFEFGDTSSNRFINRDHYSDSATTPVASGFDTDITSYGWSDTSSSWYLQRFGTKWTEP